jgi:hypothetical protein
MDEYSVRRLRGPELQTTIKVEPMRLLAAFIIVLSVAVLGARQASAAQGPVAHPSAKCNISGKERKLGATYVTSLTASGVSCSSAQTLVKAFHKCRREHGGADGKCSKVSGYRCTEKREAIPTQFDARATCTKGKSKVTQTYTQNT